MTQFPSNDLGFSFTLFKNGEVLINHHGRRATVLRHHQAIAFRDEIDTLSLTEQQQLMARLTGNYKRGNEREAKNHPRNQ